MLKQNVRGGILKSTAGGELRSKQNVRVGILKSIVRVGLRVCMGVEQKKTLDKESLHKKSRCYWNGGQKVLLITVNSICCSKCNGQCLICCIGEVQVRVCSGKPQPTCLFADVRTQAMYQMMDEGFIGLILSVFNQDKVSKVRGLGGRCPVLINQGIVSPSGTSY